MYDAPSAGWNGVHAMDPDVFEVQPVPMKGYDPLIKMGNNFIEPANVLFIARKISPYDFHGTSFLDRLLTIWEYEKLMLNDVIASANYRTIDKSPNTEDKQASIGWKIGTKFPLIHDIKRNAVGANMSVEDLTDTLTRMVDLVLKPLNLKAEIWMAAKNGATYGDFLGMPRTNEITFSSTITKEIAEACSAGLKTL
jgi:hypothetical protein